MIPPPPRSTLFPYTTLFRSQNLRKVPSDRAVQLQGILHELVGQTGLFCNPLRGNRSEEHTSELQSHSDLVCRLLLEKKESLHTKPPHASLLFQHSVHGFDNR